MAHPYTYNSRHIKFKPWDSNSRFNVYVNPILIAVNNDHFFQHTTICVVLNICDNGLMSCIRTFSSHYPLSGIENVSTASEAS
jgi:hypothetical protein